MLEGYIGVKVLTLHVTNLGLICNIAYHYLSNTGSDPLAQSQVKP